MPVSAITEVILYVSNMQRAVQFYRSNLGLRVRCPNMDDYSNAYWVELDTGPCSVCLHGGGAPAPRADCAKIVFGVADIHGARVEMLSKGVALGEVRSPADGIFICDGEDPDGNPFSLEERVRD